MGNGTVMPRLILTILITASLVMAHRDALTGAELEASGKVDGRVLLDTGEPAVGSNVLLRDTRLGASAGEDGRFVVNGVPPGTYTVVARLVGYEMSEPALVTVRPGGSATVTLRLKPTAIELNTVTVTGTRRQSADDTRSSVTTLSPAENKKLPGAGEDVLRALQAIPGVTSVNDFSSQLVVRGSGPDQNLILIDGFEALNPYRLYGFVSMFNPETVS
ncbi:hypothetical protein EG835_11360, partial [bacterium]|nr:hypothetical protein [bacterium]